MEEICQIYGIQTALFDRGIYFLFADPFSIIRVDIHDVVVYCLLCSFSLVIIGGSTEPLWFCQDWHVVWRFY